jgi:hypothetical protein
MMPLQRPPRDAQTTERTPLLAAEDVDRAGDTVPAMPAAQRSEPIVRFREPTTPPQPAAAPSTRAVHVAPRSRPRGDRGAVGADPRAVDDADGQLMPSDPATEPMASPPAGALAHQPPVHSLTRRRRQITSATALFAEAEPEAEADAAPSSVASSELAADAAPRPVRAAWPLTRRHLLLMIVAMMALGAAAAMVSRYLAHRQPSTDVAPAAPTPVRPRSTVGTIRFVTVPADATITISGQPAHTGSPWDAELSLGRHQVEIHRDGYKGWLTSIDVAAGERQMVRVELGPLGSMVMADATLIVTSTPAGLDAVLDGIVVARTPIKLSIKPGMHAVALRRNGIDVWKKTVDAGAGTIYELHPVLGAAPEIATAATSSTPPPSTPPPSASPPSSSPPAPSPSTRPRSTPSAPAVSTRPPATRPPPTRPSARPKADVTERAPASDAPALPAPSSLGSVTPTPIPTPPPAPTTPPPAPTPAPTAPPPAPVAPPRAAPAPPSGPVNVPSGAVTKRSGEPPTITTGGLRGVPAQVSAKLCIDVTGRVTSAELLTAVSNGSTAAEILSALRGWRYAPYKLNGTPHAACFSVALAFRFD